LKSPAHLWSLDVLLDEYPDARFIQPHRDPLKMLASLSSLVTHLRKMSSNHVDGTQIAREWAHWNALGLNASALFRKSGAIAPDRVIDIDFYGFMDDPLTEVEKIYRGFDFKLTDDTRTAMSNYLAEHSATEHGSHGYSFGDTGLNAAEERERLAPYQDYFGTRMEVS
ncbi:MAG: sulfotransferase, partial [Halioglobus sp.]|nr:sulfotransferase [Halioglobus sp.]